MFFNRITVIGRLTKDPEMRYTPAGKAVTTLRLAVDNGGRDEQKETLFIDAVVWEKQAETCAHYLTKGRLILADGRLRIRQYDAQDGSKRQATEIQASTIRFLERGQNSGDSGVTTSSFGSEVPLDNEDDIPF